MGSDYEVNGVQTNSRRRAAGAIRQAELFIERRAFAQGA